MRQHLVSLANIIVDSEVWQQASPVIDYLEDPSLAAQFCQVRDYFSRVEEKRRPEDERQGRMGRDSVLDMAA